MKMHICILCLLQNTLTFTSFLRENTKDFALTLVHDKAKLGRIASKFLFTLSMLHKNHFPRVKLIVFSPLASDHLHLQ